MYKTGSSGISTLMYFGSFTYIQCTLFLFNRNGGHGSGCTTNFRGVQRYPYCVYCLTPPTYLCRDNTHSLHRSTVEQVPQQCPHPRSTVNALATPRNLDLSQLTENQCTLLGGSIATTLKLELCHGNTAFSKHELYCMEFGTLKILYTNLEHTSPLCEASSQSLILSTSLI